ncbi:lipid phosphate phosphatase 2 isoform X2 [Physcomitrium patens]|uniref:Phosphatidic acid phosphatase type 2/haloperoxidase domain-containing protein n=1 Tax=Physcomitrium patens TaxID=3218 RepID=A0A7I4CDQ8_PHYPA
MKIKCRTTSTQQVQTLYQCGPLGLWLFWFRFFSLSRTTSGGGVFVISTMLFLVGLATAITLTALFTDSVKNMVGMPRPDFFDRCFPDGIAVYTNDEHRRAICHPTNMKEYNDGFKSFPSGHVSWCFAGLGYLSLYLAGKLSLFDKRGYSSRVFFVLFPQLVAVLIAISRVNDYQHRWVDIIGAAILALPIAYFCYRQHFPSIYAGSWAGYPFEYEPQGIFSHGLHGPKAIPSTNAPQNDLEMGRTDKRRVDGESLEMQ